MRTYILFMERLYSDSSIQVPGITIAEVGMDRISTIRKLNVQIFRERRIINRLDRPDLILLMAVCEAGPVGFKVGYGESDLVFYSAKGGVIESYRRRGIARWLLYEMIDRARAWNYSRFAFDTLPNLHHGMTVMALNEGFRVTDASYNDQFEDYLLRFEKEI